MNNISKTVHVLMLVPIIIGVCSLFLLCSINESGKEEILKVMEKNGNASIVGLDTRIFTSKGMDKQPAGILSYNDIKIIKNSCPEVKSISLTVPQHLQRVKIDKREYPPEEASRVVVPCILGINPEFKEVINIKIKRGRFINKTDMIYKRKVCILGSKMYERLGRGNVVGKVLVVREPYAKFIIIGVLQKKMPLFTSLPEQITDSLTSVSENKSLTSEATLKNELKVLASEINDGIYCPLTTWQEMMKEVDISSISGFITSSSEIREFLPAGSLPPGIFIDIKINIPEEGELIQDKENLKIYKYLPCLYHIPKHTKLVVDKMRQILRKRYGEDKLFDFFYRGNLTNEINDQIDDSNKFLITTSIITFLLFGVILSSMMLLSVHKRVSEIGIRRAVGARKKDIFFQFLKEAVIITGRGGIGGIILGLLGVYFLGNCTGWEMIVPWYSLVLSIAAIGIIAIISGVYPALKAANISPAIAVKYE